MFLYQLLLLEVLVPFFVVQANHFSKALHLEVSSSTPRSLTYDFNRVFVTPPRFKFNNLSFKPSPFKNIDGNYTHLYKPPRNSEDNSPIKDEISNFHKNLPPIDIVQWPKFPEINFKLPDANTINLENAPSRRYSVGHYGVKGGGLGGLLLGCTLCCCKCCKRKSEGNDEDLVSVRVDVEPENLSSNEIYIEMSENV